MFPNHVARVSPFDRGFLVGDGAFETLRAYDGSIFAITRHWRRLVHSCEVLRIQPPSLELFTNAMQQTLSASPLRDARMRFTVTSGEGQPGLAQTACTMVCHAVSAPVHRDRECVVMVAWPRNEQGALAGVKSVSYGENTVALAHARKAGAGEAIFANTRGELCEGSASNIFLVRDGTVHTPPLSSGCLGGVTRALVIELCHANGIPVREAALPASTLAGSDEVFLTSSTREVQAVASVDSIPISNTVGPLTKRVAQLYRNLVVENSDP